VLLSEGGGLIANARSLLPGKWSKLERIGRKNCLERRVAGKNCVVHFPEPEGRIALNLVLFRVIFIRPAPSLLFTKFCFSIMVQSTFRTFPTFRVGLRLSQTIRLRRAPLFGGAPKMLVVLRTSCQTYILTLVFLHF
jgi:hypothetical protein